MNEVIQFSTDAATLAIFDPEVLKARITDEGDWWCGDFHSLQEVCGGRIALASTGGDGVYLLRVTDAPLSIDERDYAVEKVGPLGIEVVSGKVFFGRGECLPGDNHTCLPGGISPDDGQFIVLPPGHYDVEIFLIEWAQSPRYWTAGLLRPEGAPADFVALVQARTRVFPGVHESPRLVSNGRKFLFPSTTRETGPKPGMLLETKVWSSAQGLTLRECGPLNYKPLLQDYSSVKWKDLVRIQVEEVDHGARTMRVRLLEIVESNKGMEPTR